MEQQRFPREIIDFLSEEVAANLDPTILMRGLTYYEDGRVRSVRRIHDSTIQATVHGTSLYTVEIDSDFFAMSTCSCPYDGFCKHIAATFFAVYAAYESPRTWVREHKQNRSANASSSKRNIITSFEPEFAPSRMPMRKSQRFETIETPNESDSIWAWHQNFRQNYKNQRKIHSIFELNTHFERMRQDLLGYAKNWAKDKQFFYELHVLLFLNDQIFKFRNSQGINSLHGWYFEEEISELSSHFLSILNQFLQSKPSIEFPVEQGNEFIQDTKEFLHSLLTPLGATSSTLDLMRIHMYRLTWLFLLTKNSILVQSEIEYLQQEFIHTSNDLEKQELFCLALVFFDSILGNDNKAMDRLSQLPKLTVDHCLFNLMYHEQNEHWDKLLLWLKWLQHSVRENITHFIYSLSYFWEKISEHMGSDDEWVETLKHSLPTSFPYYTDYMINTNRMREWINALLFYQIPLEEVEKEHIKAVEAHDLQLLLPLFHQEVERLIKGKNRESYKQAVRYLKTLQRYYKKLKRMDHWHKYFQTFSQKYSRLRALHEELKKGKLEA